MTTKNLLINSGAYTLVSAVSYGFIENTTGEVVEYAAATSLPSATFIGHSLQINESRWWELKSGESVITSYSIHYTKLYDVVSTGCTSSTDALGWSKSLRVSDQPGCLLRLCVQ